MKIKYFENHIVLEASNEEDVKEFLDTIKFMTLEKVPYRSRIEYDKDVEYFIIRMN